MFFQAPTEIVLRDNEGTLCYSREDLIKYAGHESHIASGVVMRLFFEAVKDLSPDEIPMRREFEIISAYPGKGVRDCIEMVCRAVTEGRFACRPEIAPETAPRTFNGGSMYFLIRFRGKVRAYTFSEKIFTKEWEAKVKRCQEGCTTPEEHAAYLNFKFKTAADLLTNPQAVRSEEAQWPEA